MLEELEAARILLKGTEEADTVEESRLILSAFLSRHIAI